AEQAVRSLGVEAVPFLLKWLERRDDGQLKKAIISIAKKQRLIKTQYVRVNSPYQDALVLTWGSRFKVRYIPPRERYFMASCAFVALRSRAEEVVPMLVCMYEQNGGSVVRRCSILYALGRIGPEAKDALPLLLREANNPDVTVRQEAYSTLIDVNGEAEAVVPILIKGLQDPTPNIRYLSAVGLEMYGSKAHGAVSLLTSLLQEENRILATAPYSLEHRPMQGALERALKKAQEAP
ncbi:MAG TPA: HEAT repeat domain-containing protein, partial [Clostridia bacterium]|nr:HEAT repeat domain-containing protein [Clostridia bacterium]